MRWVSGGLLGSFLIAAAKRQRVSNRSDTSNVQNATMSVWSRTAQAHNSVNDGIGQRLSLQIALSQIQLFNSTFLDNHVS